MGTKVYEGREQCSTPTSCQWVCQLVFFGSLRDWRVNCFFIALIMLLSTKNMLVFITLDIVSGKMSVDYLIVILSLF